MILCLKTSNSDTILSIYIYVYINRLRPMYHRHLKMMKVAVMLWRGSETKVLTHDLTLTLTICEEFFRLCCFHQ